MPTSTRRTLIVGSLTIVLGFVVSFGGSLVAANGAMRSVNNLSTTSSSEMSSLLSDMATYNSWSRISILIGGSLVLGGAAIVIATLATYYWKDRHSETVGASNGQV